jgi:hypothetical protein
MGFKQFIDGEKSEILKLNEALESFYLTESLENGQRVKINSVGGDKLSSALISKYGQFYTYFDKQPKVSPEDMGKVIGKEGKVIKAIRNLMRIPGVLEGKKIYINLAEN